MQSVLVALAFFATANAFAPTFHRSSSQLSTKRFVTFSDAGVDSATGDDETPGDLPGAEMEMLLDMADLDDELSEIEEAASYGPPRPYVNQQAIIAATEKWRRHETDVGSPEYQIAVAHERIKYLTAHLQANPKDYASRRGLVAIVNKRRRLLNYLYRENSEVAMKMVSELGVRFKPPGSILSRAETVAMPMTTSQYGYAGAPVTTSYPQMAGYPQQTSMGVRGMPQTNSMGYGGSMATAMPAYSAYGAYGQNPTATYPGGSMRIG